MAALAVADLVHRAGQCDTARVEALRPATGPRAGPDERRGQLRRPGLTNTDITASKLVGEREKQVLAGLLVGRKGLGV